MSAWKVMFSLVFGAVVLVARAGAVTPPASQGGEAPITLAELGKLGCAPGPLSPARERGKP